MAKNQPKLLKDAFDFEKSQEDIKRRHHIPKKANVIVVEEKSRLVMIVKAFLKFIMSALHILANIALVLFAIVGMLAMILPESRYVLLAHWMETWELLLHLLGF